MELAATVEALYDTVHKRLKWTLDPGAAHWRKLDFKIAQGVVDQVTQAYTKAMMAIREVEHVHPVFLKCFTVQDVVWEALNAVLLADKWEDLPKHSRDHGCELCLVLKEEG